MRGKLDEHIPHIFELPNPVLHFDSFRFGSFPYILACRVTINSEGKKLSYLSKRETYFLGMPDESDALDTVGIVQTISGAASTWTGQESFPLIEADGLHVDPGCLRHFSDRHLASPTIIFR